MIAGTYDEIAEFSKQGSRPCVASECDSLIFSLLSDAHSSFWTHELERPIADTVRIEQLLPGTLEIIALPSGKRQTLSISNGDFTCNETGLRLRNKTVTMVFLFSNAVQHETRIFNVAEDGSLIMKSELHSWGHHTFLPLNITSEGWLRWIRVSEKTSEEPSPTPW
ncbi:MAG: hypothetical protein ACR2QW_05325 [bacterium]